MPLLCFPRQRSTTAPATRDSVLDFDLYPSSPRRLAAEPPLLSSTSLFDTFPRVCFGGYRRYYARCILPVVPAQLPKLKALDTGPQLQPGYNPSLSSVAEERRSHQYPPKYGHGHGGTKQRKVRRTNSSSHSLASSRSSCPQLRKKPRRPLLLSTDDSTESWPDGLVRYCRSRRFSRPSTPSTTAELPPSPAVDSSESPSTDSESSPDSDPGHTGPRRLPRPNATAGVEPAPLLYPHPDPPDSPSKPPGL
ncbi:hypothetical protein C8R45DRAFT_1100148 [Mycena sanguinolenta]|nr:hypothetical protein C8R45DRAFT_1100148 [Mycena sanguinolenta]